MSVAAMNGKDGREEKDDRAVDHRDRLEFPVVDVADGHWSSLKRIGVGEWSRSPWANLCRSR